MTLPIAPDGWLLAIDASRFQGLLDVHALVAAGVSCAWYRATDGLHDVDSEWARNAAASVEAGLPFGSYGVLEPYGTASAAAQARHFCDTIEGAGATLPPWCDFELAHNLAGLAALQACAIWCDAVEQRTGQGVIVYTGPAFVRTLERYAGRAAADVLAQLGRRPLALADYGSGREILDPLQHAPRVPPPWTTCAIWQVGPFGATLPGTRTPVDVNWIRGSIDDPPWSTNANPDSR